VPSTSFVLQQNLELSTTNWTDVPITPTINPHELAAPNHCAAISGRSFLPAQSLNKPSMTIKGLFVAAVRVNENG
jgi:hypothetical protein